MIQAPPCSAQFDSTMQLIHEGLGVMGLLTLGGILFMVRLMWADYRKKHKINGREE